MKTGPKDENKVTERGTKYHVKNIPLGATQSMWEYEARSIALGPVDMLLVRLVVGKVKDKQRVVTALRSVSIVQGDDAWNCVTWVQRALKAIQVDVKAVGISQLDWRVVRDAAMKYAQDKKAQQRFEKGSGFDMSKVPTLDLLSGREVMP